MPVLRRRSTRHTLGAFGAGIVCMAADKQGRLVDPLSNSLEMLGKTHVNLILEIITPWTANDHVHPTLLSSSM